MATSPTTKKAAVVWHFQIDDDDPFHKPSTYERKILAEGDSWFSLNSIPGTNMLESLRFKSDAIIVNCGMPGDTIRNMITMRNDPSFQREIEGGIIWDAILLSGGGNDVIDDAKWIIPASDKPQKVKNKPDQYCDTAHLKSILDMVIDGYQKLFAIRDGVRSKCKGKPVIIHTYDKATPRNSPAMFLGALKARGPWLRPALRAAQVPESEWNAVSDFILGSLADRLVTLHDPANEIHVVDTRSTLKRAEADTFRSSNDWQNEIHPNGGGYEKLAAKLSPVLAKWI